MFSKYVNGVMQIADGQGPTCVANVRNALEQLKLRHFLLPHAQAVPQWIRNASNGEESDSNDDSEINLADLPDVVLEPVGPQLEAEHHATAVISLPTSPRKSALSAMTRSISMRPYETKFR
jgi:hypothetical protein